MTAYESVAQDQKGGVLKVTFVPIMYSAVGERG